MTLQPLFGRMEFAGAAGVSMGLIAHIAAFVVGYGNDIRVGPQVSVAARRMNGRVLHSYCDGMGFSRESDEVVEQHGLDPKRHCFLRRGLPKDDDDEKRHVVEALEAALHSLGN